MRFKKTKRAVLIIISLLWLAFIFSNSLRNASSSAEQSHQVAGAVDKVISIFTTNGGLNTEFLFFIVRKIAHFAEFFILSALISLTFSSFTEKMSAITPLTLILCAMVCIGDELLQLFAPGRSCSVYDMLLDFSGGVMAFILFAICRHVSRKRKRSKL